MRTILLRGALLLALVGFALPSVAEAQHYTRGAIHHSRSITHHTLHQGYRPYYRTHYRPTYRTHHATYGRYSYRPSYRTSSPYRIRRRVYVRCR